MNEALFSLLMRACRLVSPTRTRAHTHTPPLHLLLLSPLYSLLLSTPAKRAIFYVGHKIYVCIWLTNDHLYIAE